MHCAHPGCRSGATLESRGVMPTKNAEARPGRRRRARLQLPPVSESLWIDSTSYPRFERLTRELTVDVAIVGGGITGLTAASLLKSAGKRVAVIDARRVARGRDGLYDRPPDRGRGLLVRHPDLALRRRRRPPSAPGDARRPRHDRRLRARPRHRVRLPPRARVLLHGDGRRRRGRPRRARGGPPPGPGRRRDHRRIPALRGQGGAALRRPGPLPPPRVPAAAARIDSRRRLRGVRGVTRARGGGRHALRAEDRDGHDPGDRRRDGHARAHQPAGAPDEARALPLVRARLRSRRRGRATGSTGTTRTPTTMCGSRSAPAAARC